ncbi:putative Fe-S oxidoreductase [Desulfocapsa sulfexigens DSM 10523]|uniref:Putative Fe-S oxidoreductase n=1 Tax=Desulfocapsa sulfexigens (strain DSM 10523 / SB164P1) TaxID=1167006 RepID=M1NGT9_DESSD|nr:radical SAM protein [Desulfocapsa sulfexigens]AGF78844.1 putative Fe-S oxidoreductase [Desulfocapsa sulfexigens DSM 10523]
MTSKANTVAFQAGERNIFFHILTACNLSCRHCYINTSQHGTTTLPKETMLKWLELFADPNKKSNVIFLGGEPTMHPDLADGIAKAKELGMAVTVDSNGYLFNNLLEKTSPDLLDYLSFSLDGPDPSVNDPIRGEGVFEVCTTNMGKAVAAGYNVSVIYTVSNLNIEHLHRMIPLLQDIGVKRFFIQVIGLRGNSAKTSAGEQGWQVSPEQWLDVVPRVAIQAAEAGIHVTFPKVFLDPNEKFECAGLVTENFFIFPNGRVYRCPLCEDHPIHALEIKNETLVPNQNMRLTEDNFFQLNIEEGCVMNRLLQPDTISYDAQGKPLHRISCCLLKQEILPV